MTKHSERGGSFRNGNKTDNKNFVQKNAPQIQFLYTSTLLREWFNYPSSPLSLCSSCLKSKFLLRRMNCPWPLCLATLPLLKMHQKNKQTTSHQKEGKRENIPDPQQRRLVESNTDCSHSLCQSLWCTENINHQNFSRQSCAHHT